MPEGRVGRAPNNNYEAVASLTGINYHGLYRGSEIIGSRSLDELGGLADMPFFPASAATDPNLFALNCDPLQRVNCHDLKQYSITAPIIIEEKKVPNMLNTIIK